MSQLVSPHTVRYCVANSARILSHLKMASSSESEDEHVLLYIFFVASPSPSRESAMSNDVDPHLDPQAPASRRVCKYSKRAGFGRSRNARVCACVCGM